MVARDSRLRRCPGVEKPLEPGDELRFPHCGRWHPVISTHSDGTEYTRAMLYWLCRRETYYG